jgi:hypothetical protein
VRAHGSLKFDRAVKSGERLGHAAGVVEQPTFGKTNGVTVRR